MRTYPLLNPAGELYAFEISNALISGATIARIVTKELNATITSKPTTILSSSDTRLGFAINGSQFEVWEPFGDNSRYWIGPVSCEGDRDPLIDLVHAAISSYRPTPIGWLRTFKGLRRSSSTRAPVA